MHLLIAAAGSGSRMGADRNKLLLKIAGKTVLEWTLKAAFKVHSKTVLPATFKRSLFLSAPIRLPLPAAAINKCTTKPLLIIRLIYSTSKNNYF